MAGTLKTLCCFKRPEFIGDPAFNRNFAVSYHKQEIIILVLLTGTIEDVCVFCKQLCGTKTHT